MGWVRIYDPLRQDTPRLLHVLAIDVAELHDHRPLLPGNAQRDDREDYDQRQRSRDEVGQEQSLREWAESCRRSRLRRDLCEAKRRASQKIRAAVFTAVPKSVV